ncbi:MAG: SIMPL domain-containing protein [Saprospiraceae bacterium]|nr:SIMPL domain-containing protein [Saprospiraceae bacterium]
MKSVISTIVLGIALVLVALILADTYKKRNRLKKTINVVGMGEKEVYADLIIWESTFSRKGKVLQEVQEQLSNDQRDITFYLKEHQVHSSEIRYSAIDIQSLPIENEEGELETWYELSQSIVIKSRMVDKIDTLVHRSGDLIEQGIAFDAQSPQYYFTQAKLVESEIVAAATEDARTRAEKIALTTGVDLYKVESIEMGDLEIAEEKSSVQADKGSSKLKKASMRLQLEFSLK